MSLTGVLVGVLVFAGAVEARRRRAPRRLARQRLATDPRSREPHGQRDHPHERRRRAARGDAAVAGLPEVVDLLGVAVAAGLPPAAALVTAATRAPEPWATSLRTALQRAADGEPLSDALGHVVDAHGDLARPLVALVRSGLDDADHLGAALARLATDARDLRRRRAEEAARRIPVRLLLPLVSCSLPAFAVLTIVPIVAGALDGLRFPT